MKRRKMDDDDGWIDAVPSATGHIGQLTEHEPILERPMGYKNPIGFCIIPGAHKGQKPVRWRKVTIRTSK